jgi:hypothetical protein
MYSHVQSEGRYCTAEDELLLGISLLLLVSTTTLTTTVLHSKRFAACYQTSSVTKYEALLGPSNQIETSCNPIRR